MKDRKILVIVILLIVFTGIIYFWVQNSNVPAPYDDFAKCLKEKGATFYGTFWCPHCQNQKKLFGKSSKYLPYAECSTTDGQSQTIVCKEKNIESYPTWEFSDGSRMTGETSLSVLSEKTECPLPSS